MRNLFIALLVFVTSASAACAEPFTLNTQLQEGEIYEERNLPSEQIDGWYKIPEWFAGTSTRTKVIGLPFLAIKSIRESSRGKQIDAKGVIWELHIGVHHDIDKGESIDHVVLLEEEPIFVIDSGVYLCCVGMIITERQCDRKIIKTVQSEEKYLFSPESDRTIKCECKGGTVYDANGVKLFDLKKGGGYIEKRSADFKVIDKDTKYDYRNSFEQFLTAEGLTNLIPARAKEE